MLKVIALLAGLAFVGQFALPASCAGTPAGIAVQDVIAGTQFACQFEPTAASVAAILSANPIIATVTAAVTAICGAVGKPAVGAAPSNVDSQVAVYKGTPIVGHFVTK